jgi:hypothetical protein
MAERSEMQELAEGQAEIGVEYLIRAARAIRLAPDRADVHAMGSNIAVMASGPTDLVEVVVTPEGSIELTIEHAFDPGWRPFHTHEAWDGELGLAGNEPPILTS